MGLGPLGGQGDGLPQPGGRFVQLAEPPQDAAQVAVSFDEIGPQGDGPFAKRRRLAQPLLPPADKAQLVVEFGDVGPQHKSDSSKRAAAGSRCPRRSKTRPRPWCAWNWRGLSFTACSKTAAASSSLPWSKSTRPRLLWASALAGCWTAMRRKIASASARRPDSTARRPSPGGRSDRRASQAWDRQRSWWIAVYRNALDAGASSLQGIATDHQGIRIPEKNKCRAAENVAPRAARQPVRGGRCKGATPRKRNARGHRWPL